MTRIIIRRLLLALAASVAPVMAYAQTETVTYYHTDAIGSVRMITDASGAVLARYDYQPFGLALDVPPPPVEPQQRQFAGKERDTETGYDYFGARYYAGGNGRFTTVDPVLDIEKALVDPQRWNRYAYARSNPFRYVDPDGLDPLPTVWLQFFNAMFRTDFSAVDVKTGGIGRVVTDTADASGVTLGHYIFLSPQAADNFAKVRP